MRLKVWLLMLFFVVTTLPADALANTQGDRPEAVTRLIEVKHADVNRLAEMLSVFQADFHPNPELGVLSVTASRQTIEAIEEAIRKFDVPRAPEKNVELMFGLVIASRSEANGTLPEDLQPVLQQLTKLFQYRGYRLLDTAVVRNRIGAPGELSGNSPPVFGDSHQLSYSLSYLRTELTGSATSQSVRIDDLEFGLMVPAPVKAGSDSPMMEPARVTFRTSVDIAEGQKAVVGKSNIGGTDSDLILVLSARVLP